jgi:hypothetical protein
MVIIDGFAVLIHGLLDAGGVIGAGIILMIGVAGITMSPKSTADFYESFLL